MEVSDAVRRAFLLAAAEQKGNGYFITVEGVDVPIFDVQVNPNTPIPRLRKASVYILLQDQEEVDGMQNYCSYRQRCSLTVRVVAKFATAGVVNKGVADVVAEAFSKKIKPTGKTHALIDANGYCYQRVKRELSRSYPEFANGVTVINKVIIYNTTVNQ